MRGTEVWGRKTGDELISRERQRQIEVEGWTSEHDDKHANGELLLAAASYVQTANDAHYRPEMGAPVSWPWHPDWWKPSDPIRDLVKAGALIAAEIDRLLRKQPTDTDGRLEDMGV